MAVNEKVIKRWLEKVREWCVEESVCPAHFGICKHDNKNCPLYCLDQALAEIEKQPCKTCKGSGRKKWTVTKDWPHEYTICPTCRGTGIEPDCQQPEPEPKEFSKALEDLTDSIDKVKQSRNALIYKWGRLQLDIDRQAAENKLQADFLSLAKEEMDALQAENKRLKDIFLEIKNGEWDEKCETKEGLKEAYIYVPRNLIGQALMEK